MARYLIEWQGTLSEYVEANSEEEARAKSAETPFDWDTWLLENITVTVVDTD